MIGIVPAPPVLTDGVVTLRAHTPDDIDDMVTMCADPESGRWTTAIPIPYGRSDAERFLNDILPIEAAKGSVTWAIEALDGSRPRYAANLALMAGPPPEIGYVAAPWARGRGFMTRAVRLATRWGFDVARLPVVQWKAIAGNIASWRVAHACGFAFHGTIPQSLAQRGELRDCWYASLHPDDEQVPRTTWWRVPELRGTRVRLRAHTEADVQRIVEACSDESTQQWLAHLPRPYTERDAREYVAGRELGSSLGQSVTWAVTGLDDDRLLANISIFKLDDVYLPTGGEIGYWAHPDARGRGVVSEAVELVVKHAFTPVERGGLGRHRLQIGAAWSNTASRRVAERAGFTLVGHYHKDGVIGIDRDKLDDGAWYELLADEN
jgi:[ribosomal protein S5]-alanine N-acetyltransferase